MDPRATSFAAHCSLLFVVVEVNRKTASSLPDVVVLISGHQLLMAIQVAEQGSGLEL